MSIYDQNLKLLQERNPQLAESLLTQENDANVQLQQTQTKMPTLLVRTETQVYALHHPEDPLGFCQKFLASISDLSKAHNIAVLGCGLGYIPLLILQQRPNLRRLFILEPSISVFRAALHTVNLNPLLSNPNVVFIVGSNRSVIYQTLMAHLMEIVANSLLLIDVPSSTTVFPEWAQTARQQIQELIQFGQSGLMTKFKDGPLCISNVFQNLDAISSSPGIREVGEAFKNIPAIVVAAGPSLEKNIDQLKEAQNSFLIIATDTSFHPLLKRGIVPHFVVTVDPTELNTRHFPDKHYSAETILLFDPEAQPQIVTKFPQRMTFMTDKHQFFEWLDKQTGEKGFIKKGGMVSQAGFQTAVFFGCSPIILIGQDLALEPTTGATHASETALRRNVQFIEGDRDHANVPIPGATETISKESLYWVEGIDDNPVPTMHNLLVYLRMVEEDVREAQVPVIDATEGGAKIHGTFIHTLAETIQRERKETVDLSTLFTNLREQFAHRTEIPTHTVIKSLGTIIQQSVHTAKEGLDWLETHQNQPLQQLEETLDQYRTRIFSDPVAEYLIEYGAPRELFEFLRLGPADADENEKCVRLQNRYRKLLEAVQTADERLKPNL